MNGATGDRLGENQLPSQPKFPDEMIELLKQKLTKNCMSAKIVEY